ncbi:amidase [Propylenella binzhouense]|uniref:amidase n=1 Tax=Propylenella binzhouense TaxID=2555902 RepID=UPI0031B62A5C
MSKAALADLDAGEARGRIARGETSSVELVEACLARIEERDPAVRAWAHLDPAYALAQAEMRDRQRGTGRPLGPLHGVPVGLKDVIDAAGLPCENGTVLDSGRRPQEDSTVAARLRAAGAVILGKTVTTELAVYSPGPTANPHDTGRTPGGSSSGSAAAVAARMVPLAVGTQTNGSVIRPASFCGVYGYKPGRGMISRRGVLVQSPLLDAIGVFARSGADCALIADALAGYDPGDRGTRLEAFPALARTEAARPPVRPLLAFVKSPVWDQVEPGTAEAFAELCAELGGDVAEVGLPPAFADAHRLHGALMLADIARNYARYTERGADSLSARLRGMIEEGRAVRAVDYAAAIEAIESLNAALEAIFDRFDAILTPAAAGEAPVGLGSTGSPAFCTIWTFCGVPALTLPLLVGPAGLPLGVQLVGRRGQDGRLLRTARWLVGRLAGAAPAVPEERPEGVAR